MIAYRHDTSGRRTDVTRTGTAFAASHFDLWGYNDRSELAASLRYLGSDPTVTTSPDADHDRLYEYDSLGNRTAHEIGPDIAATYVSNGLNQQKTLQSVDSEPSTPVNAGQAFLYDADGNLARTIVAGDIDDDGSVTQADYELVDDHFGQTCATAGDPNNLTAAEYARADMNGDCVLNVADLALVNTYLDQSTPVPLILFNWDAENRLVSAGPPSAFPLGSGSPDPNDVVSEYRYDYLGRRVEKLVKIWSTSGTPGWVVQQRRFFIYNGWTMLLELDARDLTGGAGGTPDGNLDNVILRKHTWGLDLAGQSGSLNSLQGAGGIGGLLGTLDTAGTTSTSDDRSYIHFYDGNGNVGQLLEVTGTSSNPNYGTLAAKYEYDAYGNNLLDPANTTQSGTYAATNTFRFSTKAFDAETGLSYFGYRYYSAAWGRWINRDPLEERGGYNLYCAFSNVPSIALDPLGLTPELWTCSGINNWSRDETVKHVGVGQTKPRPKDGRFNDYVGDTVVDQVGSTPKARFVSKLGPGFNSLPYQGDSSIFLDGENDLDDEAENMADGLRKLDCYKCKNNDGTSRRFKMRVVMMAPKTTTLPDPMASSCCDIEIKVFWNPNDFVPNQGVGNGESHRYWSQFGKSLPVNGNHADSLNHDLGGYISDDLSMYNVSYSGGKYTEPLSENYSDLGLKAPNPMSFVRDWVADESVDFVFVCHSQGCNIAMHALNKLCNGTSKR